MGGDALVIGDGLLRGVEPAQMVQATVRRNAPKDQG